MKKYLPWAVGAIAVANLLSDERSFGLAVTQWRRQRTAVTAFHLITSGLFLAADVARLG
jgi:hypothetical protein